MTPGELSGMILLLTPVRYCWRHVPQQNTKALEILNQYFKRFKSVFELVGKKANNRDLVLAINQSVSFLHIYRT